MLLRATLLIGRILAIAVLVFSGAYLLIYLYRWEWNRALVSGLFFLAAEVALLAAVILNRLRGIERRLDEMQRQSVEPILTRIRESEPERSSPFPWLGPKTEGFGVFIPVLLGAGVIISGLAYLLERVAKMTATPVAEHDLARRLAPLAPPSGGLVPTHQLEPTPPPEVEEVSGVEPPPEWTPKKIAEQAAVVVALLLVMTAAVMVIRESTQARPDPASADAVTAVEISVSQRQSDQPVLAVADALWVSCRLRVPSSVDLVEIGETSDSTVQLVLHPALGETDRRQFVGCLQDATIDRINARVLTVTEQPIT